MSTATAPDAAAAAAPAKGKKKLIVIIAAVALLLAVGGGTGLYLMKKKAADAEAAEAADDGGGGGAYGDKAHAQHDAAAVPVFVPLEPFTVNLADRDAERYAQVGITLELDDAHVGDRIKAFMPAIRNRILMAIADRTAGDLMNREGKAKLAETVRREAGRALGYDVERDEAAAADDDAAAAKPAAKKRNKKKAEATMPIKAVHFSNFIIQ